jgi:hypothetical protein
MSDSTFNPGDYSLPAQYRKATFKRLYSELELQRAALRMYTKSLFSWRKAISRSHDDRTLFDFARRGPQNVERLHEALRGECFDYREGLELTRSFNGRERTIYLYPWEERLVDLMLFQTLNRYFHGALPSDVYAYRHQQFGVDVCQRRLAAVLRSSQKPVYVIRRDVRNYFASIDHDLLLAALAEWVEEDDYLYDLLRRRVGFAYRAKDGETPSTATQGVPFGTAVACFLANMFLTPIDRAVAELDGVAYFRYADDILVVTSDRGQALEVVARLDRGLAALKLKSKSKHHADLVLGADDAVFERAPSFRYLGLQFRADGSVRLSRDKFRKICNRFKYALRRKRRQLQEQEDPLERAQLAIDICRGVIENGSRPVAIIDYYLKHVTDEEQLRLLDRWLAEEILAVVFKNGHRKGNFRRLPFKRMRQMGLPSLRHRRRLLQHGHIESSFFVLKQERLKQAKQRWLPSRV